MHSDQPRPTQGSRGRLFTANLLFLCTHNTARSLLAEAIANRRAFRLGGPARLRAFSAGAHPARRAHPLTLELLERQGYAAGFAQPKSWRVFARPGAPEIHLLVQVCARDPEPPLDGLMAAPPLVRWPTPDPTLAPGDRAARRAAFARVYALLEARVTALLAALEAEEQCAGCDPQLLKICAERSAAAGPTPG